MWQIGKRMAFDAAHTPAAALPGCPARLHGHTYTVEVAVASDDLQGPGFVIDFSAFGSVFQRIDEQLDHRLLDDVLPESSNEAIINRVQQLCDSHLKLRAAVHLDSVSVWSPLPAGRRPGTGVGQVRFEAAHRLPGLPPWHKCGRVHGHSYTAEVSLSAPEVTSAEVLEPFVRYVSAELDGTFLNDSIGTGDAPTSENLARHLHCQADKAISLPAGVRIRAVRVAETASTWAEYLPEPL